MLDRPHFQRDSELTAQINEAAISVMFNIAEGFLRRRDKETLQFLRYAFASNGELESGYCAAAGRKYLGELETSELIDLNERIARMLRCWQATLEPGQPPSGRTQDLGRTKAQERTKNEGPSTKDT